MKRYYTVASSKGKTAHRMFSATKVEGNLTKCGRSIAAGWLWTTRASLGLPVCKVCSA